MITSRAGDWAGGAATDALGLGEDFDVTAVFGAGLGLGDVAAGVEGVVVGVEPGIGLAVLAGGGDPLGDGLTLGLTLGDTAGVGKGEGARALEELGGDGDAAGLGAVTEGLGVATGLGAAELG